MTIFSKLNAFPFKKIQAPHMKKLEILEGHVQGEATAAYLNLDFIQVNEKV